MARHLSALIDPDMTGAPPEGAAMTELPPPRSSLVRFLGGSPVGVVLRLAVLSVIVGVLLNAFGLDPYNILTSVERLIRWITNLGWDAVERLWGWFVLGAVIVIPIWLISRLVAKR
jgi:Family of unknown function (DUF6460)